MVVPFNVSFPLRRSKKKSLCLPFAEVKRFKNG
jgi:hypothetical protein